MCQSLVFFIKGMLEIVVVVRDTILTPFFFKGNETEKIIPHGVERRVRED